MALLDSRRDWTGALLAGLAALGIFFALNPYILWHFDAFWHDFTYEREHMALGHFGQDRAQWTVAFYAVELAWAVGVVGLVALWGLRDAVRRRAADGLVLYCWVGVYLLLISTWEMRGARYLLPVVPVLLVLGAQGLWRQRMRGVLVAVLVVYGGTQAWALNDHYAALTAPEALMAIEHYTYYPGSDGSYHLLFRLPIDVVHPERFPVQAAFYRHLENDWRLVRRFDPDGGPGPEIVAYANPRRERVDGPFPTEVYSNLAGLELALVDQFLGGLQQVLAARGYPQRARNVGLAATAIARLHREGQ